MPFLRAGFNASNVDTGIRGWTRNTRAYAFSVAQLRRFQCGDYFWYGRRFLAWGEQCVLGSYGIALPYCWQYDLACCDIDTRRENVPRWPVPETLEEAMADG